MRALLILLLAFSATADTLYERIAAKLEAHPELATAPSLAEVEWMAGEWDVTARVFATDKTSERIDRGRSRVEKILGGTWLALRDTYPSGTQDLGYLTFNTMTREWIALHLDSNGNAVRATSPGWNDGRLVFVLEDIEILGERITLRQTIEKRSAREYRVLNEERVGGGWAKLDEYVYVKR